jgi:ABC-type nitrate/sulfonate/bicarbonate transport system substrate-binding protein
MSWTITPGGLAPILFAHPGIAKHEGVSYVIEPIHFAGGPLSIPAIAKGEIDIGGLGDATRGRRHADQRRGCARFVHQGASRRAGRSSRGHGSARRAGIWYIDYIDPANRAEAVKIVAEFNKQPLAAAAWAFTRQDQFRSPDALPDLDALQRNVDLLWKLGFLKGQIDIGRHGDLSPVREADARLRVLD